MDDSTFQSADTKRADERQLPIAPRDGDCQGVEVGQFGDNHKVELGKKRSKTNGVKLRKMTSSLWVFPQVLVLGA